MKRPEWRLASTSRAAVGVLERALSDRRIARGALFAVVALVFTWVLLIDLASAEARPGGGQGRSGGSRSGGGSGSGSGGGSGGGDGELVYFLVQLVFREPRIGIPVLVIVAVGYAVHRGWLSAAEWSTERARKNLDEVVSEQVVGAAGPKARAIDLLQALDPEFSFALFEDFAQALYARVHEARGGQRLDTLSPYVSPEARAALAGRGTPARVEGVVIGAMIVEGARQVEGGGVEVRLRVEANYTEVDASGAEQGFYVVERWTMARGRGATSRPPQRARTLDCPSCGAPLASRDATTNTCRSCGKVLSPGEFDWSLRTLSLDGVERVPPALSVHVEEEGTHLPTVVAEGGNERLRALCVRDPGFDWHAFVARVHLAFAEINAGWSTKSWPRARPFVSDAWFQTQRYWLAAYERHRKRNVVEDARVVEVLFSDARTDKHFDSLTVRVFAKGLDYTLDEQTGRVCSGSRTKPRAWSEYWTFVRSAKVSGASRAEKQCPHCGAPLDLEMTGECRYCKVHVTSGEFDWVLSRVEQDESVG